ncbi:MAG: hypothetical protein Fur0036_08460 [Fimbriimonadaceae bacterium]
MKLKQALLVTTFSVVVAFASGQNQQPYDPEVDIILPWQIYGSALGFYGCVEGGWLTLNWTRPLSWKRVASTAQGALQSESGYPLIYYTQSTQTVNRLRQHQYLRHSKGTFYVFEYSAQCPPASVPPFIPNSSPQVSESFLYNLEHIVNDTLPCVQQPPAGT